MSYEKPLGHKDEKQQMDFSNPLLIILNFALAGITVLFLALTAAYLFSSAGWKWTQFGFPKWFVVSALVLAASSFCIHKTLGAFRNSDLASLRKYFAGSVALSCGFVGFQIYGWYHLQLKGIYLGGHPDGSYLYLISGLHALHVLAGMLILFYLYFKSRKKWKDPVENLLYFSDPKSENQLILLNRYWHFLDILWIYLLVFFLLNHL